MKKIVSFFLLLVSALANAQSSGTTASPAERSMSEANKAINKKPAQYAGYNLLAMALARRARETSDVKFYGQAEDALKKSFELAPANLDGEKIRVWLLLGRHEFPAALQAAQALNKRVPDDVLVYGFLTDANAELGNYDAAEKAAQWMLDLRPGNLPGMTRAAYLRELFGDLEGALELMNMAYQSTPPTETEDRAWILSQIGHLHLMSGDAKAAETTLQQALTLFPGYHYALGNLAKVRIVEKRYPEAVDLLQQRYRSAPHAENLYDLAEALELSGRPEEAKKAFVEFEAKSLQEAVRKDNSSRELIFFYADHAHQPAQALQIAEQERAWRHDVYTLDAHAWALHLNGKDKEARVEIEAALKVGVRDPRMLRHAAEIALADGDRSTADHYLQGAGVPNATASGQTAAR
jgi:tetratricopeptide (TPR) repeat protein